MISASQDRHTGAIVIYQNNQHVVLPHNNIRSKSLIFHPGTVSYDLFQILGANLIASGKLIVLSAIESCSIYFL
jgi:hypothetical protein